MWNAVSKSSSCDLYFIYWFHCVDNVDNSSFDFRTKHLCWSVRKFFTQSEIFPEFLHLNFYHLIYCIKFCLIFVQHVFYVCWSPLFLVRLLQNVFGLLNTIFENLKRFFKNYEWITFKSLSNLNSVFKIICVQYQKEKEGKKEEDATKEINTNKMVGKEQRSQITGNVNIRDCRRTLKRVHWRSFFFAVHIKENGVKSRLLKQGQQIHSIWELIWTIDPS